jgi:uncharacterized protein YhdP
VLPQVESYRNTVASMLTRELGRPVEIATLTTDWDGWNPKLVVQGFACSKAPAPIACRSSTCPK